MPFDADASMSHPAIRYGSGIVPLPPITPLSGVKSESLKMTMVACDVEAVVVAAATPNGADARTEKRKREIRLTRHVAPPPMAIDDFFFSSRRRHTRLQGDWSSDVCSSD